MKVLKDVMRFLNIKSLEQAMKGLNEAPEPVMKKAQRSTTPGRNRRHYRNHRKVWNAIAAESRRRNRCQ